MKHGIVVREHKNWNTKTIWNRGYRMVTYRHQPKRLRFESPMVNDINQHMCGGWAMDELTEHQDTEAGALAQLLAGRKPFATLYLYGRAKARAAVAQLEEAGLAHKMVNGGDKSWDGKVLYIVYAAQDMTVAEIGDLDALRADYADAGIFIDTRPFEGRALSSFFGGGDDLYRYDIGPDMPPWMTGLILGYPIENTISVTKGQVS